MTYIVRKIERARWVGSDVEGQRIMADVVASCIRPNASELSVWYAEDDHHLEEAKLAMLANMNKLATVDLVIIPMGEIEKAGLNIVPTLPTAGPESLKTLHRDIADLDLDSLKKVAEIVQRILSLGQGKRITMSDSRKMLEKAIADQKFAAAELHQDISRKLTPV